MSHFFSLSSPRKRPAQYALQFRPLGVPCNYNVRDQTTFIVVTWDWGHGTVMLGVNPLPKGFFML